MKKIPLYPLDLVPDAEIQSRLARIRSQMAAMDLSAILLTHRPDIYYFTGTGQDAWVLLSLEHDPLVFVRRWLPRALAETPLKDVIGLDSVTRLPEKISGILGGLPKKLGLSFDLVPVRDFKFYASMFPETALCDAADLILGCRSIKSPWEMAAMDAAARVSARVFAFMAENLEPGLTETQFAGMIEAHARTLGHSGKIQMRHYRSEGFSFHIMSGPAGGMPGALNSPVSGTGVCTAYPFGAGPRTILADEPILVDFSTMIRGYHMDESRMFCAGRMPDAAMDASRAAMDLLFALRDRMRPGMEIRELFRFCVEKAGQMNLSEAFLGLPGHKAAFVGHGIGLELVEPPVLAKGKTQELLPGMVFAVEPKFVFRDRFAAGVESVIRVTERGGEFISVTPHKIFTV